MSPPRPSAGGSRAARRRTRTPRSTPAAGPSSAYRRESWTLTRAALAATLARVNLAEILVTIALLGAVFAGTLTALEQGQRAYTIGAARVEAQQNGRFALERLASEIRHAGAGGVGFDAISVAERERIILHVDRDGDGRTTARGETITWRLAGTVLRRDAGGGAQPIVDGVRSLVLEYLRSEEHTSELQSPCNLVCRLLLEKKKR